MEEHLSGPRHRLRLFITLPSFPRLQAAEEFWTMKKNGISRRLTTSPSHAKKYRLGHLHLDLCISLLFGIVWHIYWLIFLVLIGVVACVIILSFDEHMEYVLPVNEIARIEKECGR